MNIALKGLIFPSNTHSILITNKQGGKKQQRIITKKQNGLTRWFTNLEISKQNDILPLYKKYSEKEYIKYDNFDWIDVWKVADIPSDYDWAMWVPITIVDSFNPQQFEILCCYIFYLYIYFEII